MQEIKIKNREYILNNNGGKYDRVFDPKLGFGKNPTNEQILAYYDKFAGLILDENRGKIENGSFWKAYERKLVNKQQRKENLHKIKNMASSFVEFIRGLREVLWFILLLSSLCVLIFGYEKIIPIIKDIKKLI